MNDEEEREEREAAARNRGPELGVETKNFDPSVRPQDDFFRYVNGNWAEEHARSPRTARRYGSFIELRRQERDRPPRASSRRRRPRATPAPARDTQKVGDLYPSFMDSAAHRVARHRAGARRPRSASPRVDEPRRLPSCSPSSPLGVQTPFARGRGPGPQAGRRATSSTRSQSGLGLPDRDYYLQAGARFVAGARRRTQRYIDAAAHARRPARPRRPPPRILALETRAGGEAVGPRAQPRPQRDLQQDDAWRSCEQLDAGLRLDALPRRPRGSTTTPDVIVRQPDYFQALDAVMASDAARPWQAVPHLQADRRATPTLLSSAFEQTRASTSAARRSRASRRTGRAGSAAWRRSEGALGEALGKLYVERILPARERRRAWTQLVEQPARRVRAGHRPARVDEPRDQGAGAGEARASSP